MLPITGAPRCEMSVVKGEEAAAAPWMDRQRRADRPSSAAQKFSHSKSRKEHAQVTGPAEIAVLPLLPFHCRQVKLFLFVKL